MRAARGIYRRRPVRALPPPLAPALTRPHSRRLFCMDGVLAGDIKAAPFVRGLRKLQSAWLAFNQ